MEGSIRRRRAAVNEMLKTFGIRVQKHGGDVDEALVCLEIELSTMPGLDRDRAIALLAYTVRRLWHTRTDPVKTSVN